MKKLLYLLLIPCSLFLFSCEKDEKTEPETKNAPSYNTEIVATANSEIQSLSFVRINVQWQSESFDPDGKSWSKKLNATIGDTLVINAYTVDSSKIDLFINYNGTGQVLNNGFYIYTPEDGMSAITGIIVE